MFADRLIAKIAAGPRGGAGRPAGANEGRDQPALPQQVCGPRERGRGLSAARGARHRPVLQPTKADGAQVTVTTLLLHSSGEWLSAELTMTAKGQQSAGGGLGHHLRPPLRPARDGGARARGRRR